MATTKVNIEATVATTIENVWQLWTEPKHITHWNFAADDWQCPWATNNLKAGGKFTSRMEAKDGSFGFDMEGTYDEVVPQKKISYTMADGRKATTTFEARGPQTHIVTVFDAENQHPVEYQKSGWQAILNNFKRYSESQRA